MFKTELSIEEEIILKSILDGEKLSRVESLHRISDLNYDCNDVVKEASLKFAKSLFKKIQNTSNHEFNQYATILIKSKI